MEKDPFKKYLKESEPDKASKGYAWSTAIGLQAVDGLRPSRYLIDTAIQNIEGKITLKEAQNLINSYYEERPVHVSADERTEEADKVSSRIAEILSENAFSFSPNEYISIHHRLFKGIYKHAGKIRDYNITKKEWVLDGASVIYGSASELRSTLEYDFLQERGYSYKGLSMDEIIHHFAVFVSRLWQIHIFGEGNTRTTAVFFIKYLRTLGFSVTNSIFAENAWYFRNALVRANYTDLQKGVHETTEYLEVFLRNLLLNEKNELHNRSLHISGLWDDKKVDIGDGKVDILYALEKIRTPFWNGVMGAVAQLGGEVIFIVAAVVVLWCVSKWEGSYLMSIAFCGTVLNQFLKLICRVPRPWVRDPNFTIVESARAEATGYSFPSGHTQNAIGLFGGMARWGGRRWVRLGLTALALVIAFSRMYLGVHTPADVGVSLVLAAALVLGP